MSAWDLAAGAVWAMTPSALETVLGGGVAVVPVVRPLFQRANLMTQVSGPTSVEVLATARTAVGGEC